MLGEIYKVTCIINNKSYIGQVVREHISGKKFTAEVRWRIHVLGAKNGHSSCKALSNAILKYGAYNFIIRVLLICDEHQLNYYENKYVRQNNTLALHGYNIRHGGGSRGRLSDESRKLISIAKSGTNNHMWGKHHSDEAKIKIGQGNKGKVRSIETRMQISNTKGRNDKNQGLPMYVYHIRNKNNFGYCIKYHPNLKQYKIQITTSKMTMDEKHDYILDKLKKLYLNK